MPAAIVLAGALIGLGLFFGLRSHGPVAATEPAASAPSVSPDQAAAAVARALDAQRADLARACPSPEGTAPVTVTLEYTFDPAGKQLARGLSSGRESGRSTLPACLSRALQPVQIPPPGAVLRVEVPFRFP